MVSERIVTFLPSATELIYSLGAEDRLFGVTHECNYPSDVKTKPRIITSSFDPASMSSKQIDDKICQLMTEGKTIEARFSFVYSKNDTEWKIISHHSSVLPET